MAIMVTGGKGFIGRRLVKKLQDAGNDVVVLDKEQGGVLNKAYLEKAMMNETGKEKVNTVFHLGAVSGSVYFSEDPIHAVKVNCEGTINLLETALKQRIRRIVFAGTMSAYGFTPIPHTEDGPVSCPNSYVASKLFGERLMRLYWENHGIETVNLRFSSVYGPGEETKGRVSNPVTQFIWAILRGDAPIIFDKGDQTRDLVFVDDVVSALMSAMLHGHPGQTYNVSTGVETSMNTVMKYLREITGKDKIPVEYVSWKPYDQQRNFIDRQCGSFDKIRGHTLWFPRFTVIQGLSNTYGYYVIHPDDVPSQAKMDEIVKGAFKE